MERLSRDKVVRMVVQPVRWQNGQLSIIDQTRLPAECRFLPLRTVRAVWQAIRTLQVRGAPAIGVCAAFGVLVALREKSAYSTTHDVLEKVREAASYLATSRPTAVNLFWALDRMQRCAEAHAEGESPQMLVQRIEAEAVAIYEEDLRRCRAIGDHGAPLIREGWGVLTHCNAGALATAGYGTALALLFRAHEQGRRFHVYVDETRPVLQGARLTTWELLQAGIDVVLICDHAAAHVMRDGRVQLVVVGADRIAANGDVANKIGTYSLALVAKAHQIPFYVAAPLSSFDISLSGGEKIPIEQRPREEVVEGFSRPIAPEGVAVYNPAFDVTPAELITGIITERGILEPPYLQNIAACFAGEGDSSASW